MRIDHPNFGEIPPGRSLRYPIPIIKRLCRGLVTRREFPYRSMAYDSQSSMFTRCEPNVKQCERFRSKAVSGAIPVVVDSDPRLQFA